MPPLRNEPRAPQSRLGPGDVTRETTEPIARGFPPTPYASIGAQAHVNEVSQEYLDMADVFQERFRDAGVPHVPRIDWFDPVAAEPGG